MLVRDVIKATATAGGVKVEVLLTAQTRGVQALRHLGLLVSARLTAASWTQIGKVWGGRDRATAQAAALKADARIAAKHPDTMGYLVMILDELGAKTLPAARPASAGHRRSSTTIRSQIAQTEARLRALRHQLREAEADAR
jgi:hypothetical protein